MSTTGQLMIDGAPTGSGDDAAAPAAARRDPGGSRGRELRDRLLPVVTTLLVLALWELLPRIGVLPKQFPPFSDVVSWLWGRLDTSDFWSSFGWTMWQWFAGLVLGGIVGAALGVVTGAVPLVHRLVQVPFEFLRPIPAIVYMPLLILVMGSTSKTGILMASLGSLWPMLFQTFYGVHAIDRMAIESGTVFGLSAPQRLRHIIIPSILPFAATGLRIASSLSLVVAISVELIGGVPGLGSLLADYSTNAIYPGMYAILLVSGVLGLVLNLVLERTERRVLRWHVSHRKVGA